MSDFYKLLLESVKKLRDGSNVEPRLVVVNRLVYEQNKTALDWFERTHNVKVTVQ